MRFTLADALDAAERLIRGGDEHAALAAAQKRAAREDSVPNLIRDMLQETMLSLLRSARQRLPRR